jgi:hypothetical protein
MPPSSTFRVDLVDALYDLLIAYQTANPTLLRRVYRTRPSAFQELPSAFVGPREESITHTSGTRERTIAPSVVVVDTFSGDNEETGDRMDILMDDLVDVFTAGVSQIPWAIIEPTAVIPGELEASGAIYRAESIQFARTTIREGRS